MEEGLLSGLGPVEEGLLSVLGPVAEDLLSVLGPVEGRAKGTRVGLEATLSLSIESIVSSILRLIFDRLTPSLL